MGIMDACAGAIELETMIPATNAITSDCFSHTEGRVAVRATVFERPDHAIFPSPKNEMLPAHDSGGDRADLEIGGVNRAIPVIADPIAHNSLPLIPVAELLTPFSGRRAGAIIAPRCASLSG